MFFRKFDMFLIFAMLAAAAYTYSSKHTTKRLQKELASVERAIADEKDAMVLLKAEWGLLTQPANLQALLMRFGDELQLQTLDPAQITVIDAIPMRPQRIEEIDEIIATQPEIIDDSMTTGGVQP